MVLCPVFIFIFSQHSELNNIIEKHNVVFTDDGNTGLIGQVVVARQKSNIKRYTQLFKDMFLDCLNTTNSLFNI